jgi:putative tryptophan/tyrosine transport system substrate-binding protein
VIGWLHSASPGPFAHFVQAFRLGLKEAGFVEGQNVAIEYRWADGQYDRLPALAADLVHRGVALIAATGGPPAARAAKAVTTTIPIVFVVGADPVKLGLVAKLNRPEDNLTGVSLLINVLAPKQLEVLHEVVPKAMAIAVLVNPDNPNAGTDTREVREAARVLGRQLFVLNARNESDVDAAFANLVQQGAGGFMVVSDPILGVDRRDQLVALAARYAMPAIYPLNIFPAAGGLMSYGSNLANAYRDSGVYTGKILKGAKPADLPVLQSTKIEFVINLKTAQALGLTIPLPLLGRADEVIE